MLLDMLNHWRGEIFCNDVLDIFFVAVGCRNHGNDLLKMWRSNEKNYWPLGDTSPCVFIAWGEICSVQFADMWILLCMNGDLRISWICICSFILLANPYMLLQFQDLHFAHVLHVCQLFGVL